MQSCPAGADGRLETARLLTEAKLEPLVRDDAEVDTAKGNAVESTDSVRPFPWIVVRNHTLVAWPYALRCMPAAVALARAFQ